ncbi:hypothetical protein, unlikely [Trypanosoma brucei gambiense DAL972]|uniref:Uncharacterized protein n=1 Tax=Trypanosoma brucei gambiense (strain MHOM/CI/86/DAL972) TaxID=679716 RepID=C9ZIU6_TRYB9|nr:hypothetical protein, unlikely [Trypanosoma brucei gambiense DAL972]CBH09088.1 hypothetical protein, unlikely [Trypanosoma brucei gambiense DAL972]|eukprot:XP_011771529.1 hypothetical protein, unlikely [Trypanosoma brucei gambiense DAL972]
MTLKCVNGECVGWAFGGSTANRSRSKGGQNKQGRREIKKKKGSEGEGEVNFGSVNLFL